MAGSQASMRCVRVRPSLATRWRRVYRGQSCEVCSCPYPFRCSQCVNAGRARHGGAPSPDKPPGHSECRRGRERGRSIPFTTGRFFGPTVANGALRTWLDLPFAPPCSDWTRGRHRLATHLPVLQRLPRASLGLCKCPVLSLGAGNETARIHCATCRCRFYVAVRRTRAAGSRQAAHHRSLGW